MFLNNINCIYVILTELILFFGSLLLLFYPLFSNKKFYIIDRNLFFITLIILFLSFISLLFYPNYLSIKILFYNMLIFSYYTLFIKLSIILMSFIFIYILQVFNLNNNYIINEFYFLYIFSILISFLAISSFNLVLLFIFLECLTYILYTIACSIGNLIFGIESALKYFFMGSLSSIFYILGCSIIYGFSNGCLNYDSLILYNFTIRNIPNIYILGIFLIIISFIIKMGAFPFHIWIPDVYEGIWTPITFFFSIIIKLVFISIFLNLLFNIFINIINLLNTFFIIISIGSMIIGSIGAIYQETLKRFILYSSIAQIGFIFAGISNYTFESLIYIYIFFYIYIINSIIFFFIIIIISNFKYDNLIKIKYITDLSAFLEYDPFLFFIFSISLLSMAGFPPLSGFFGKYLILSECFKCNNNFLGVIFLLVSIITCYYYFKIIKISIYDNFNYFTLKNFFNYSILFIDKYIFYVNIKDHFKIEFTNFFYYPFHILLLLLITLFNILFIFFFFKFYLIFFHLTDSCIGLFILWN